MHEKIKRIGLVLLPLAVVGLGNVLKITADEPNHSAVNLLKNGGFESWDKNGRPTSWILTTVDKEIPVIAQKNEDAAKGKYCLRMDYPKEGKREWQVLQKVKVKPGTTYIISVWMKKGSSIPRLVISERDQNRKMVKNYWNPVEVKSRDWKRYRMTFLTDPSTRWIYFSCMAGYGAGDCFFDQCSITESDEVET